MRDRVIERRQRGRPAAADDACVPTALVTGASQGLGRSLADECARRGMDLLVAALPESGLEAVASQIAQRWDTRVAWAELDLTADESPQALLAMAHERGLHVCLLINNAGVGCSSRFEDATLATNEACILLNNLAPVRLTHTFLPELRRQNRAFILNVASLAAFFPMPLKAVYAPSKAFVLNFSLALREEMRHTPVSVSVLCPAGMRTNATSTGAIDAGGWVTRMACVEVADVAKYALDRALAGQAVIIPGRFNQAVAALARVAPRSAVFAVVSALWGRGRSGLDRELER